MEIIIINIPKAYRYITEEFSGMSFKLYSGVNINTGHTECEAHPVVLFK